MNDEQDDARAQIEALETTISYQEVELDELSAALYEHSTRIERLEAHLRDLTGRLKELHDGGLPSLPEIERPPHY